MRERVAVLALFFLSGFTGLVYEVLWLEELGLLFGSASHSAATTLAVFFLGLALGSFIWGRKAPSLPRPLRTYGLLEIGIAASGLLYFVLVPLYRRLYEPIYALSGDNFALLLTFKFLLAAGALLPAAFLMGGTLPVLAEHRVRDRSELAKVGTVLYGVNTAGAACGAFSAGFLLPPLLGFSGAYVSAVVISLGIGIAAIVLAARSGRSGSAKRERSPTHVPSRWSPLWGVAFGSGFLALGLEVVWTRMFSQVLQNSVYTFSTILVLFLISLALGSFLASLLSRSALSPRWVLTALLTAAGVE